MQLANNLTLIHGAKNGFFPFCNSLLIKDELCAIIDAGGGEVSGSISKEERLDALIFSHFHPDHGREAHFFYDLEWWAHEEDAPAISDQKKYLEFRGYNQTDGEELISTESKALGKYPHKKVTRLLKDNEELNFGKSTLIAINIPGHTPGHTSFYEADQGLLYAADIDLSSFGPWYGDDVGNVTAFIDSINKIIELKPKQIIPGHGNPISENIPGRLKDYRSIIYQREDNILSSLKKQPFTLEDLATKGLIYRRIPQPQNLFVHFERNMIKKHLERLIEQGLIQENQDLYEIK